MFDFTALIAGRSEAEFCANDRDKVVFSPQAIDPSRLLTASDLDDLLETTAVGPPFVKLTRHGVRLPDNAFSQSTQVGVDTAIGVLNPDLLMAEFRAGCTVSWSEAQRYLKPVREACAIVSGALREPTAGVVFATPAAKQGFNRHSDLTDVFAIQLLGAKTWTVWSDTKISRSAGGSVSDAEIRGDGHTYDLQPGDCLYVPWGVPHVAHSNDQFSVHLSITVRPVLAGTLIDRAVRAHLDPATRTHALAVDNLRSTFDAVLDDLEREPWQPECPTPAPLRFFADHAAAAAPIDPTRRLRRLHPITIGPGTDASKRAVTIGPRKYQFPTTTERVLTQIAGHDRVSLDQLVSDGADPALAAAVLKHLLQAGGISTS